MGHGSLQRVAGLLSVLSTYKIMYYEKNISNFVNADMLHAN